MGVIVETAMDDLMTFRDIGQFPHRVTLQMRWEEQHARYESIDQWIAEMKPDYRVSGFGSRRTRPWNASSPSRIWQWPPCSS